MQDDDRKALQVIAKKQGYDLVPTGQQPHQSQVYSPTGQQPYQPQNQALQAPPSRANAWSLTGFAASPDQAARKERQYFRYALIGATTTVVLGLGSVWIIAGTFADIFSASVEVTNRAMGVIEHQATVAGDMAKNSQVAEADKNDDRAFIILALLGASAACLVAGVLKLIGGGR